SMATARSGSQACCARRRGNCPPPSRGQFHRKNPRRPTEMADRLKDKVVLLFGAGSSGEGWGNGKATAALFAQEGGRVVGVDLNLSAAEETRARVAEMGYDMDALCADVTDSAQVRAAVAHTVERYGRIDVLHN